MSKNKKTVPDEIKNCSKNTKIATKINRTPKLKATLKLSENSSKVRFKTILNIK
jgi:spore coat protein CotF